MGLRRYTQLARKWLWLVVLATLASGGAAYVVNRNSVRIYQASAIVMVSQASNAGSNAAYLDILTSERLAQSYSTLLTGWTALEGTAERLGVDPQSVERAVSVEPIRDTQLLEIKVQSSNPQLAARIANTLPQVFIEQDQRTRLGQTTQSKASLEKEIASTATDIANTQDALTRATDDAQRIRLEASLAQFRNTYSNLLASYEQIKITEAQTADNIVLAQPAKVPEVPIRPRTLLNTALAMMAGAVLAAGAVFLIEYLDDTVKSPDDVRRVSGLSTLGAIARLREAGSTRQLVSWLHTKAPESEAYRALRTNIQFTGVDKPIRTLLITSSGPGEGKSTTAANLAVVMAQAEQRVLLVDTDLRRPVLHRVFGTHNNTGLTTALLADENSPLEEHIRSTEVTNLSLLTSGPIPPNPSELLGSQRMTALVRRLAVAADVVIFDSPPVLVVTDAAVLGSRVDGVILVVESGRTREQALTQSFDEMRKVGANVLGVALNRLDSRGGGYYYYYYYEDEKSGQRKRATRPGTVSRGASRRPWQRRTEP